MYVSNCVKAPDNSGRVVSAESDLETLGRTGCVGEQSGNSSEIGLLTPARRFG
jgi:hypothetical protein